MVSSTINWHLHCNIKIISYHVFSIYLSGSRVVVSISSTSDNNCLWKPWLKILLITDTKTPSRNGQVSPSFAEDTALPWPDTGCRSSSKGRRRMDKNNFILFFSSLNNSFDIVSLCLFFSKLLIVCPAQCGCAQLSVCSWDKAAYQLICLLSPESPNLFVSGVFKKNQNSRNNDHQLKSGWINPSLARWN